MKTMTPNPTGREGLVDRARARLIEGYDPLIRDLADRIEALEGEGDHWKANHADLARKYRKRATMIAGLLDMLKEAQTPPGPNATRLRRLQKLGVHVTEGGSRSVHVRSDDFDWLLASATTSQARVAELEREREGQGSSVSQSAAIGPQPHVAPEAEPSAEAILLSWCDHVEPLLAGRHDHVRMTPDEALVLIRGVRALLDVLPAARAARTELKDHVVAAYEQGALDVHANWQEDADPDFKEAAYDYAASVL